MKRKPTAADVAELTRRVDQAMTPSGRIPDVLKDIQAKAVADGRCYLTGEPLRYDAHVKAMEAKRAELETRARIAARKARLGWG